MNKLAVVVQGPVYPEYINEVKNAWLDYTTIFSTWDDCDTSFFTADDILVTDTKPDNKGKRNYNYQITSTLNGINKAYELGFDRVLKWRGDMIPNNPSKLVSLFEQECINLYSFVTLRRGYVTDYFMEGTIEDMLTLFTPYDRVDYPEQGFTTRIKNSILKNKTKFILNKLTPDNDVYWGKEKFWLRENQNNRYFLSEKGW